MKVEFNRYFIVARVYPALLAILPVLALALTLVPLDSFQPSQGIAAAVLLGLTFTLGDIVRRTGRATESEIFEKLGGRPSVVIMRHRDSTLTEAAKKRYVGFVAGQLGSARPTADEEAKDPEAADELYEQCATWLRERTRDQSLFPLLLEENITYGFRRNLYGTKPFALALSIGLIVFCAAVTLSPRIAVMLGYSPTAVLIVGIAALAQAAFFTFGVGEKAVMSAAHAYGRQLVLSAETLMKMQA